MNTNLNDQFAALSLLPSVPALDNTLGVLLICTTLGCMLFGLTIHQTYRYFLLYPSDGRGMKLFVYFVVMLDILNTALSTHVCYFYLVTNYFNPKRLLYGVWSIRLGIIQTGCVVVISHCFHARRVFLLSGGRLWPAIVIICLLVTELGLCMGATVEAFIQPTFKTFQSFAWLLCSALGTAVTLDVFITVMLIYYLRQSRTGFKKTDSLVDLLVLYAANTGLSTSLIDLAAAVTAITMPGNLIYSGLYIIASKMYTNSLLAVLNSRRGLMDQGVLGFNTGSFGVNIAGATSQGEQPIPLKSPTSARHQSVALPNLAGANVAQEDRKEVIRTRYPDLNEDDASIEPPPGDRSYSGQRLMK